MTKMNIATANSLDSLPMPQYLIDVMQRRPFNATSDLSKFGKQEVSTQISPGSVKAFEADSAMAKLENF